MARPCELGRIGAPRPNVRLFFALFPDADAVACIVRLARALRNELTLKSNSIRAERLHVTLHFLGNYTDLPGSVIAAARVAAGRVVQPRFEIAFDRVSSFGGRSRKRALVMLGGDDLSRLHALRDALAGELEQVGLTEMVDRRFTPHLTLLYDDRAVASRRVDRIAWTAREFVLVHSLVGRGEHCILDRWPLTAAPAPQPGVAP
ncbi:MAG: RNA 2',3'-cyclic phosphodiesterase [Rhodanobacteraceae bacterium]